MKRLAVLISGGGTNLQVILDACQSGRLPQTQVVAVVSNHRDAYGIQRARAQGIPVIYHPLKPYRDTNRSRVQYDADLAALLAPYRVELICLAGWMHIFSMAFLQHYPQRVINIHPALPGTFPGMHAIEAAWRAYQHGQVAHTGVMVHYAPDEGVDVGPVILQQSVPIYPDEALETLEARVHATEYRLYPQAITAVLSL